MPLPDVDASRAVLIGTADYHHLESLPAVANNLAGLLTVLRDPDLWGLPAEHCAVLLNPGSVDDVLEVVHRAARAATDTLLIYYAGHGLLDSSSELALALPGSDTERMYRAVRYADIRREIVDAVQCRDKAVILDCCLRGRADPPTVRAIADRAAVDGAWLLAGGAAEMVVPGDRYTAFTGELINVLDQGIADGPDLIDTDALYLKMMTGLTARQRPVPQQRARGPLITLTRNRARPDAVLPPSTAPADQLPALRMTPVELAARVAELRAQGNQEAAAAALTACGRRRPDQEVAAIMVTLAGQRRPMDVAAVAYAASLRDPHELRRIYEVLVEIDQRPLAIGLLKVVAAGLPERAARFVAVLDEPGTPHARDAVPALLRSAVTFSKQRPQRLIDLLGALLLAHRTADADLALTEAERVLPATDLAVVADALRDAGRDEHAYRLYGHAADAVARRSPAQVAAIVAALHRNGSPPDGLGLARRAVTVRAKAGAEHLAGLIAAFGAEGLDEVVADAAAALGPKLPGPALNELTRLLRESGWQSAALRLTLAAAADRPVTDILRLTESLTEQGRPMDALDLLTHAARVRPVADLTRLTGPGSPNRNRRVFAAVAGQQPRRAAALYRLMAEQDDGRLEQIRAELLRRGEAEIVAVVAELIEAPTGELADDLLRAALRTIDAMTPQRLAAAAVRNRRMRTVLRLAAVVAADELPPVLREIMRGFADPGAAEAEIAALLAGLPRRTIADIVTWIRGLEPDTHGIRLTGALAARPVDEVATVVAAVTRPDSTETADDLLATVARAGPVTRVADLIVELRRRGERAHLRTLVEVFDGGTDLFKLASWLWLLEEYDLALLAVRGRLWLNETGIRDALAAAVAELLHEYASRTACLHLAFPALTESGDADELRRSYPLADDELTLLVLPGNRVVRRSPVLFTERGVHHIDGSGYTYVELADQAVSAGHRNAVVFAGPAGAPVTWAMPSAAAAKELVDLLIDIQALSHEFREVFRTTTTHVHPEPMPDDAPREYEMDGETS
ncbi:MAG TPA: caspase family protein [Actinoplanes sp.]